MTVSNNRLAIFGGLATLGMVSSMDFKFTSEGGKLEVCDDNYDPNGICYGPSWKISLVNVTTDEGYSDLVFPANHTWYANAKMKWEADGNDDEHLKIHNVTSFADVLNNSTYVALNNKYKDNRTLIVDIKATSDYPGDDEKESTIYPNSSLWSTGSSNRSDFLSYYTLRFSPNNESWYAANLLKGPYVYTDVTCMGHEGKNESEIRACPAYANKTVRIEASEHLCKFDKQTIAFGNQTLNGTSVVEKPDPDNVGEFRHIYENMSFHDEDIHDNATLLTFVGPVGVHKSSGSVYSVLAILREPQNLTCEKETTQGNGNTTGNTTTNSTSTGSNDGSSLSSVATSITAVGLAFMTAALWL